MENRVELRGQARLLYESASQSVRDSMRVHADYLRAQPYPYPGDEHRMYLWSRDDVPHVQYASGDWLLTYTLFPLDIADARWRISIYWVLYKGPPER